MQEIGSVRTGAGASNTGEDVTGRNELPGIAVHTQSFCSACPHTFNPEAGR